MHALTAERQRRTSCFYGSTLRREHKVLTRTECIGKKSAHTGAWQKEMNLVFEEAHRVLRNGGHLAVYVQDIWLQKQKTFAALGYDVMWLGSYFFQLIDHVAVVRRNKDLERGNYRKAADENTHAVWL